jgi:hypothetical protein
MGTSGFSEAKLVSGRKFAGSEGHRSIERRLIKVVGILPGFKLIGNELYISEWFFTEGPVGMRQDTSDTREVGYSVNTAIEGSAVSQQVAEYSQKKQKTENPDSRAGNLTGHSVY